MPQFQTANGQKIQVATKLVSNIIVETIDPPQVEYVNYFTPDIDPRNNAIDLERIKTYQGQTYEVRRSDLVWNYGLELDEIGYANYFYTNGINLAQRYYDNLVQTSVHRGGIGEYNPNFYIEVESIGSDAANVTANSSEYRSQRIDYYNPITKQIDKKLYHTSRGVRVTKLTKNGSFWTFVDSIQYDTFDSTESLSTFLVAGQDAVVGEVYELVGTYDINDSDTFAALDSMGFIAGSVESPTISTRATLQNLPPENFTVTFREVRTVGYFNAINLRNFISTFSDGDMIIINTFDEPSANKNLWTGELSNNFITSFANSAWDYRSAYLYIGIKNGEKIDEQYAEDTSAKLYTTINSELLFDPVTATTYTSIYDEFSQGGFKNKYNVNKRYIPQISSTLDEQQDGVYVVLDGYDRKTATVPFKYWHPRHPSQRMNTLEDVFHFSVSVKDIDFSLFEEHLRVSVYHSKENHEDVLEDLTNFYSKNTSSLIDEIDFDLSGQVDKEWVHLSIDLLSLNFPSYDGIVWFEIERIPRLFDNPFTDGFRADQIFNSWYRFSHLGDEAVYPFDPQDELETAYVYDIVDNKIVSTQNFRGYTGFVSFESYENYNLEVRVKSGEFDNDAVGLIIGFVFEDGKEYTLSVLRALGQHFRGKSWLAIANCNQASSTLGEPWEWLGLRPDEVIDYEYEFDKDINPFYHEIWDGTPTAPKPEVPAEFLDAEVESQGPQWNMFPNGTKIRIEKRANIVKLYTSQFNDPETIDPSTEIEIDLSSDPELERFIYSRIGISNFSAADASWEDVTFEPLIDVATETTSEDYPTSRNGFIAVGGMGTERTYMSEELSGPVSNPYFIETINSTKFVIDRQQLESVAKFNLRTFELSVGMDGYNQDVVELMRPDLYGATILDYNNINMILQSKTIHFDYSPFTGGKSLDISKIWEMDFVDRRSSTPIFEQTLGGLKVKQDLITKIWEVNLAGITYNFGDLPRAEYTIIRDNLNLLGELPRAEFTTSNTQDLILDTNTGLYYFKPSDQASDITKSLYFGKPKDINIPINHYFAKYKDSAFKYNQQIEEVMDVVIPPNDYFIKSRDIVLDNTLFKETVKIFEFDYPKSVFFDRAKDIQFNVAPFYTETLDKTYINKLFFIDLDEWNTSLNFSPFQYNMDDVSYIIEQNYLLAKDTGIDPKNSFKFKMLEEIFKPKFIISDQPTYEFIFDSFVGVSSNLWDSTKFQPTYYEKYESGHPRSDGSDAYGHEPTTVEVPKSRYKEGAFLGFIKENSVGKNHGCGAFHVDQEYRETQVLGDVGSGGKFLFEFSEVDWDLDKNGSFESGWGLARAAKKQYNFTYEIIKNDKTGRLPDCLELDGNIIKGRLSETDMFVRKNAFETWMKSQGQEIDGAWISHADNIDYDYSDFQLTNPRIFTLQMTGTNTTRGELDVIHSGAERYSFGEVIVQGDTTLVIDSVGSDYTTEVLRDTGVETVTVTRYEYRELKGEIDITSNETTQTSVFVPSTQTASIEIAKLQEDLVFATGNTATLIQERIDELQDIIDGNVASEGYFAITDESPITNFKYVESEETSLQAIVHDFIVDNTGGLIKNIEIVMPIWNNFTYDKDLFLHKSDKIQTPENQDRLKWIEDQRNKGYYTYDPSRNNTALDIAWIQAINNYNNGIITYDDYAWKKNFIINSRSFMSEEKREEYIEYIESFVKLEVGTADKYNVNKSKLSQVSIDYFNTNYPYVESENNQFTYLENIEPFVLNCEFEVSEEIFYDFDQDAKVIRGYPVYASCN